ncbi:MAG: V-type ATP synthase subunit D [Candidatus Aminicenantes bacterium]|nr:V-type ATP synthase subunit D [Candidatus Aminicenantes bacterium]
MAKIKLTKNELKKQRDALKTFRRYLPTLQMKKQQLQMEIRGVEARRRELRSRREAMEKEFRAWIAVFGEEGALFDPEGKPYLAVASVRTSRGNVAGVDIPVYEGAEFSVAEYDLFETPLWVDAGIDRLKKLLSLDIEDGVLGEQIALLAAELRTTSQRVNLFEKVKIPESLENIRRIRISLGDQQIAQVVRGKIAQRKVIARTAA